MVNILFNNLVLLNMNYSKCDVNKHNLLDIAELIYQTEPELTKLFFGRNKTKAIQRIIKLIRKKSNSFSYNIIFLAHERNKVVGIVIGSSGKEINKDEERKEITNTLDFFGSMRLLIYDKLIVRRMLTSEIKADEYYISVLCVNKKYQRKGIGKNLINNVKQIAKEKKCTRIILDVSTNNTNAITFYKKLGFKIYDEINAKLFFTHINVYKMYVSL
jgi:ribosomal protein S18 acetylase RimI-like enzyme